MSSMRISTDPVSSAPNTPQQAQLKVQLSKALQLAMAVSTISSFIFISMARYAKASVSDYTASTLAESFILAASIVSSFVTAKFFVATVKDIAPTEHFERLGPP